MNTRRSSGLKGQQAGSPGQRPGWMSEGKYALKGQKHYFVEMLLPFQGGGCARHLPRALPWATCLLAFQAVAARHFAN